MRTNGDDRTYQSGNSNLRSPVEHIVVDGPTGSYSETVEGVAACGQPVYVRGGIVSPRHWLCVKCRKALDWGPNRTLQEMGEV